MFNFFKKKSEAEILNEKYSKLLNEAYELSKTNRAKSDSKYAEAEELVKKIQELADKQK